MAKIDQLKDSVKGQITVDNLTLLFVKHWEKKLRSTTILNGKKASSMRRLDETKCRDIVVSVFDILKEVLAYTDNNVMIHNFGMFRKHKRKSELVKYLPNNENMDKEIFMIYFKCANEFKQMMKQYYEI